MTMDAARDDALSCGSARRRRERRLRHERLSVAMAPADALHHSAQPRARPGENEQNNAPQRQTTPPARDREFFIGSESDEDSQGLSGQRPDALLEPGRLLPGWRLQPHIVEPSSFDVPALQTLQEDPPINPDFLVVLQEPCVQVSLERRAARRRRKEEAAALAGGSGEWQSLVQCLGVDSSGKDFKKMFVSSTLREEWRRVHSSRFSWYCATCCPRLVTWTLWLRVLRRSEWFPRTRFTKRSCACDCGRGPVSFGALFFLFFSFLFFSFLFLFFSFLFFSFLFFSFLFFFFSFLFFSFLFFSFLFFSFLFFSFLFFSFLFFSFLFFFLFFSFFFFFFFSFLFFSFLFFSFLFFSL